MIGLNLLGYVASSHSATVTTNHFFRYGYLGGSWFIFNAAILQGHISPLLNE